MFRKIICVIVVFFSISGPMAARENGKTSIEDLLNKDAIYFDFGLSAPSITGFNLGLGGYLKGFNMDLL